MVRCGKFAVCLKFHIRAGNADNPKKFNEPETRTRGLERNKQFPCVSSREQQRERFWCLFQPLDDVEFSNYTTLRNPLAEVGKSLGIAINIVRTTRDGALS